MKGFSVKLALGAAAVALAVAAPAQARHHRVSMGSGDFSAREKANAYCMTCHSRGARGFQGYRPIPQLAGLPAEYIQIQLTAFAEGRRQPNLWYIKYSKVHGMSLERRNALGQYLTALPPAPHGAGSRDLVEEGNKIFHAGAPRTTCRRAPCATAPRLKGREYFPGWQVSGGPTSSTSLPIGINSAAKVPQGRTIIPRSWPQSRRV